MIRGAALGAATQLFESPPPPNAERAHSAAPLHAWGGVPLRTPHPSTFAW